MHKASNPHRPNLPCAPRGRIGSVSIVLAEPDWRARRTAHQRRVDGWLAGHLARRRTGRPHPVEDFLFTYYSYRPAQLRRWYPGAGVVLEGATPDEFGPGYRATPDGLTLAPNAHTEGAGSIRHLLAATATRPANLGCFGMHEWAMVYRLTPEQVRHTGYPLRLSPQETAEVVEGTRIRCSHFDAYRFFTAPARPLNELRPTRADQPDLEQPGCLHANMDLYKWAYKLVPMVGADLVADCFALAREIRTLDMRASPYDLTDLGYAPVPVETSDGRARYAAAQRDFADRATRLRSTLIDAIDSLPLPA